MKKFPVMTFVAATAAVIAAGLILNWGKKMPILEDAHDGFGG